MDSIFSTFLFTFEGTTPNRWSKSSRTTVQVHQDRQHEQVVPQAELHVVAPQPAVHVPAGSRLDFDVDQESAPICADRHFDQEVHLATVARGPVGKALFVEEDCAVQVQALRRGGSGQVEEVREEGLNQTFRKLIMAGQGSSPGQGAGDTRAGLPLKKT